MKGGGINLKKAVKDYLIITVGILFIACGINFFLVPHNLAAGGLSGLAMVINHYFPALGVGIIMICGDVFFFIIGFIFIGKNFGVKTVYSSLTLSITISLLEWLIPMSQPISNDVLISLIFGILISAFGMAIVFNRGAATGGTDIPAKILNKYAGIEIGKGLLIIDFIVTILALMAFGATTGLYAILGVIMNGYVIDFIIDGFNIIKRIEIMSDKTHEIRKFILNDLQRSATIYKAVGAYDEKEKDVIVTVMGKKEFRRLRGFIKTTDPTAFIITYSVHEVIGEGFGDILG